MKICKTHSGKEFKLKEGTNGPFYSHVISGTYDEHNFVYHSVDLDKIDSEIVTDAPKVSDSIREPVSQSPTPNWNDIKDKERLSMFKMSALKAASEIIAAEISRPDATPPANVFEYTEKMCNQLLNWLKSDSSQTTSEEG